MSNQVMRAICESAGWTYCEGHDRPRYMGSNPCDHKHPREVAHHHACPHPERECICGAFSRPEGPANTTEEK